MICQSIQQGNRQIKEVRLCINSIVYIESLLEASDS
jgi:hypothetical protein